MADIQTLRTEQLIINGQRVDASDGGIFDVLNPATNEVIAKVAKAGIADVEAAVSAARAAFDEGPWPRMSPYDRGRIIQRVADR
ncbi:MAG: aldehyde dehydrogenase family protein, partial [Thermomicrobiales bacterium]|nr:aldehyde dehydrogenase family protein [Thermomicrobiales bacterium]